MAKVFLFVQNHFITLRFIGIYSTFFSILDYQSMEITGHWCLMAVKTGEDPSIGQLLSY